MKKFIIAILAALNLFAITSCGNQQLFDTVYTYKRAIVSLPDGTKIEGKVESWTDYAESDSVQVKIDGVYYYTHLQNVVLISD